jgi:hypothetical protein
MRPRITLIVARQPALRVIDPGRDEAPLEQIERPLAGVVVLADDKQFLAQSAVEAPRHIRKPAVGHVQPIDQPVAKGTGRLNNSSAHDVYI